MVGFQSLGEAGRIGGYADLRKYSIQGAVRPVRKRGGKAANSSARNIVNSNPTR